MRSPAYTVLNDHLACGVLTTLEALEALTAEWRTLWSGLPGATPFQSIEWVSHCARCLRSTEHLMIVTVREEGKLVGVGPFLARPRRFGVEVRPIGTGEVAYFGLVAEPERIDVAQAIGLRLASQVGVKLIYFPFVFPGDVTVWNLMVQLENLGCRTRWWIRNVSHVLEHRHGYSEYLSGKSGKSRRGLMHEERKLRQLGELGVSHFAPGAVTEALLQRLAEIQARSWQKERHAISYLTEDRQKDLILAMARAGMAEVFLLSAGQRDIGFVLNFFFQGARFGMLTAFDESLAPLSPGKYLMSQVIRQVLDRGPGRFELMFGNAEYKRFWCNRSHHVLRWIAWRGAAGELSSWFPHRLDRFLSHHPRVKRWLKTALRLSPLRPRGTFLR